VDYADGHLFFGRKGNLFAQRFDERQLKLSGEPFRVAENLGLSGGDVSDYAFSVSPRGTIVYRNSQLHPMRQLTWFNRKGELLSTVGDPGPTIGIAVSPSDQQVLLNRYDPTLGGFNFWLLDLATGVIAKFTSGPGGWARRSAHAGGDEQNIEHPTSNIELENTGAVIINGQSVRFTRPGLVEEYTVSRDGVRQDFVVLERPAGIGDLALGLAVSGARVEPAADGARLVLENSGRKIAYSRLRVTDAMGKELTARLEVVEDGESLQD